MVLKYLHITKFKCFKYGKHQNLDQFTYVYSLPYCVHLKKNWLSWLTGNLKLADDQPVLENQFTGLHITSYFS